MMESTFTVRQAVIGDVPRLVPLFDAYRVYFGQQENPYAVETFLFKRFRHLESVIFVAEEGAAIIGFAQLYPSFSSLSLARLWILNDFFIAEPYRGKGVGNRLLQEVKSYAALTKSKGLELTVEHINQRAWTFWERQGFKRDEEFRTYFLKLGH